METKVVKTMRWWKWTLLLLLGFILFLIMYGCFMSFAMAAKGLWTSVAFSVGGALFGLSAYAVWMRMLEHRPVSELSIKRLLPDVGAGLSVGLLFFCIVVGVMAVFGAYRVGETAFCFGDLFRAFTFFLCVGTFEEILFRGFVFRMIADRWNLWAGLAVSALFFGFAHCVNANASLWSSVAITIEAGILLGVAYLFRQSLWLPIGIHWAWNFVQGNVFGFAVSGSVFTTTSVLTPVLSGPDLLTGGPFGAEASCIAVAVGVLFAVVMYLNREAVVSSN